MPKRILVLSIALALVASTLIVLPAEAQLGGLARRASNALNDEIGREIEALLRDGVRCVFNDLECIERAEEEGKTPVMTDAQGNVLTDEDGRPITDPEQAAATGAEGLAKPGTGAWANYDFVPGERVLFAEDFTNDNVGDFPRRLTFINGNWEIVEWQGQRLLRNTGPRAAAVKIELPETLPERFTIEMDAHLPNITYRFLVATEEDPRRASGNLFQLYPQGTGVKAGSGSAVQSLVPVLETLEVELTPVRIMVDGRYVKMYVNERRVANIPNAQIERTSFLVLYNDYAATEEQPIYVTNIRVAAGGRDLYDVIEAEGRVATQGIYFATDSDVIRPESTPTLTEIGDMLTEHPELRLTIEGHTDSDGDDAYNQELSDRRAAAVKTYLVETFHVDGDRLETIGLGESAPVADNATPEGKQQNRRVELVRQEN